MVGMNRSLALTSVVAAGLALAGCGAGAKETAVDSTAPTPTIAGVGVATGGPPPEPNTLPACVRRWNGAGNTSGRSAARQRAPKAAAARIQPAGRSGYFREQAGRCLIYLITPPKSAVVFVEAARGRFTFVADATGRFTANADLRQDARLRLR
jgi:hypothetical protein